MEKDAPREGWLQRVSFWNHLMDASKKVLLNHYECIWHEMNNECKYRCECLNNNSKTLIPICLIIDSFSLYFFFHANSSMPISPRQPSSVSSPTPIILRQPQVSRCKKRKFQLWLLVVSLFSQFAYYAICISSVGNNCRCHRERRDHRAVKKCNNILWSVKANFPLEK